MQGHIVSRPSIFTLSSFLVVALAIVLAPTAPTASAQGGRTRPISQFVDKQGTYCLPHGGYPGVNDYPDPNPGRAACNLFIPPVENYFGWFATSGGQTRSASVDYAGLAEKWLQTQAASPGKTTTLGTTTSGTIVERPLPDGRAEVAVQLHTRNALAFGLAGSNFDPYVGSPLAFGYRAPDVYNGARPGLADSDLYVVFVNTKPGADLPDLQQLFLAPQTGQELRTFSFRAQASGPLRSASGSPEGTPGRLTISQTGLFGATTHGALADGFPAEILEWRPVGQ